METIKAAEKGYEEQIAILLNKTQELEQKNKELVEERDYHAGIALKNLKSVRELQEKILELHTIEQKLKGQISDEIKISNSYCNQYQELKELFVEYFVLLPDVILTMGKDSRSKRCEALKEKIEKLLKQ